MYNVLNDISKLSETSRAFEHTTWSRLTEKTTQGFHGWDNPRWKTYYTRKIVEQSLPLTQKDCIDIANYCMFVWAILEKEKMNGHS